MGTVSTAAPVSRSCAMSERARSACSSGYARDGGAQRDRRRQGQELLTVAPRVRGDAQQAPLLEQLGGVAQRRDVAQVDARDGERAAAVERAQRDRHELAGRREQDRGVERLGRRVVGVAGGRGAERRGRARAPRPIGSGRGPWRPRCERDLGGEVRRAAEAVDAEPPAGRKLGPAQRAVADDARRTAAAPPPRRRRRRAAGRRTPRRRPAISA